MQADLVEYNMGGFKFTYMSDKGDKLSKLDRFLVCRDFMDRWLLAKLTALAKKASDPRPLLLSLIEVDFGHIPFRFFNSWLELPGFVEFVGVLCKCFRFSGPADLALATKLKRLKGRIKDWIKAGESERAGQYKEMKEKVETLERIAENRNLDEEELESWAECRKFIQSWDRMRQSYLKQKSRSRWALEGDENTSFFPWGNERKH
ncbi:hypothetical protein Hanom_Chr17g01558451 [Helianthus anomalus]